jgi:transposase
MHKLQELVRLHRLGTGAREVARLLGISPNTERFWRGAFAAAGLLDGTPDALPELGALQALLPARSPPQQVSSVAALEARIVALLGRGATPKAIHDRLRLDDPTFSGSYFAVKRLCARLSRAAPPNPADVAIPVETRPGLVAQVDFGYAGFLVDPATGKHRRAWVFVMVLAHSRHLFARIVFDQKAATWQQLHVEAFAFFGGVPEVIVPDNLKSAVIRAAFGAGDDPALNRSYCEAARHYGFKIDPTPPADPEKKGKVERGVQYVRRNALKTLPESLDLRDANRELTRWVLEIAGTRTHGVTHRRPLDVFEADEKAELLPLPGKPFVPVVWHQAKVHRDSHVVYEAALYSVPWRHLGVKCWVRALPSSISIYVDDQRVADHPRVSPGKRHTEDAHLPEERRDYRHRGRAWWELAALGVGPESAALVAEIFDSEDVLYPIRKVQAIVTHLQAFPKERAEGAARRARRFNLYSYRGIKEILMKGLDLEVAPPELPLAANATYRFTRAVQDMLDRHLPEDAHEH